MRHYDLWIKKFDQRKLEIIDVLKNHHRDLDKIKKKISLDDLAGPLADAKPPEKKSMCFIDGGEGYKELLGAGLYFVRATSLVMKEALGTKFIRDVDLGIISFDDNTKDRVELLREALELEVAIRSITEHKPDYAFLDGSLYVKSSRKPIKAEEYSSYVKKFNELIAAAKNNKTLLVGVSEDSKSRLLKQYLSMKYNVCFPDFMTDPTILNYIVDIPKYSTLFLPLKKSGISYTTTYIKVHRLANPMKIDVVGGEKQLKEILPLLSHLSKGSQHYGYPVPLYLAHLDARIDPKHADWSAKRLKYHALKSNPELGAALFSKTRRDVRPKH